MNWAGFETAASQTAWQRVGKLPCLAWQGWELPSSAVRGEHLCFGKWAMFVLRRSNRLPAAVRGDSLCHGPSKRAAIETEGEERGNPCIESSCRNRERERERGKVQLFMLLHPPCNHCDTVDYTLASCISRERLTTVEEDWKLNLNTFKMITGMKVNHIRFYY